MGTTNGRGRRSGGIIGIVLVAGYIVLRFGFIAYREREQGMAPGTIALTLVAWAAAIFVVIEIVLAVQNSRTRNREQALAVQHPGAHLLPVMLQRTAAGEIETAARMLGTTPTTRPPRRGLATLVADQQGLGLYIGGATPTLVFGIPREHVQSVGNGETSASGRYAFGKVDAIRVVVANGQWTAIDLPVYRTVIGFAKTLRGDDLDARVQQVAMAAGVRLQTPTV